MPREYFNIVLPADGVPAYAIRIVPDKPKKEKPALISCHPYKIADGTVRLVAAFSDGSIYEKDEGCEWTLIAESPLK